MALLLILAACQGETPTQPRPGSGGGSGTPPPTTSVAIALSVSNASPVVSSTSTVSASVTQAGAKVPDGTAVEFSTDFGTFTDTGTATTIRTTTNGVATAVLTSPAPGTANVTARVNSANSKISVAFRTSEPIPGPPVPTISSVTPTTASPAGGTTVIIRGANLTGPVKVLFGTKEAIVVSRTDSQITVLTPKIDLGPSEQFRELPLVVITQAGTAAETLVNAPANFRFEITILTPVIRDIAPSEGPNEGNTRITIFGEAFQAPVRVFFGTSGAAGGALLNQVEAEVQSANFDSIIVITPPATGFGTALANQQVAVRVLNSSSGKDAVLTDGFRYGPDVRVTAAGPTTLSPFGGDKVTIDGWGFDDPVAVSLAGIAASPIFVSGTKLIVISGQPLGCTAPTGDVKVTNVEDGTGNVPPSVAIAYRARRISVGISPTSISSGGTLTITVADTSGDAVQFTIGGKLASATRISYDPLTHVAVYSVVVPSNLVFTTQACQAGGTQPIATDFPVVFEDISSGCPQVTVPGLTVTPPNTGKVFVTPPTLSFSTTVGTPVSQQFTIVNNGAGPLTINSLSSPAGFSVSGPPSGTVLDPCGSVSAVVTYNPAAPGSSAGSVTVVTTGGTGNVTLSGTAAAAPPAGP